MKNTALVSLLLASPMAMATTVYPHVPQSMAQEAAAVMAGQLAQHRHTAWAAGQQGPGYTPDTAWRIENLPSPKRFHKYAGSMLEVLLRAYPWEQKGYTPKDFSSCTPVTGGKAYIVATVIFDTAEGECSLKQWYDVSAYVPFATEQEATQARSTITQSAAKMTALLRGVTDTAGANAAAVLVKEYTPVFRKYKSLYKWLWNNENGMEQDFRAAGASMQELDNILRQLSEKQFYNSTALREAIYE